MNNKSLLWDSDYDVALLSSTGEPDPKYPSGQIIAGCDEAGRGCLAGPVVAAAVILPEDYAIEGLDDSKKLTSQQREKLRFQIEDKALAWAVGFASNHEIDRINILNATFLAMHRAISCLSVKPSLLLIDGNRFLNYPEITHRCIVKGDSRIASISAASVLAKTYRDALMKSIHLLYPHFLWDRNKGYPTSEHLLAIRNNGITSWHRKTFTGCRALGLPFDDIQAINKNKGNK